MKISPTNTVHHGQRKRFHFLFLPMYATYLLGCELVKVHNIRYIFHIMNRLGPEKYEKTFL